MKSALYYTILFTTSHDSGDWAPCGEAEQGQDDFEFNASGTTRFYKASVLQIGLRPSLTTRRRGESVGILVAYPNNRSASRPIICYNHI